MCELPLERHIDDLTDNSLLKTASKKMKKKSED